MFLQSLTRLSAAAWQELYRFGFPLTHQPGLQLEPLLIPGTRVAPSVTESVGNSWSDAFWFAVPKKKVTKSKKRMKTTRQKRIPLKKNIVADPRTGEPTLMHKLPFSWRDYLPKIGKEN